MWDDQIDDVARRLTAAEPPHRLGVDVLRRLEQECQPRGRERTKPIVRQLMPVVCAVALTVGAGILVGWHLHGWRAAPALETAAVRHNAPRSSPMQTDRLDTTADSGATAGSGAHRPVRRRGKRPSPGEDVPDFIERLAITPLSVGSLGFDGITPPAPIVPDALAVVPLPGTRALAGNPERN
jgi:hypothetical protein